MTWEISAALCVLFAGASFVAVFWLKLQETKHRKTEDMKALETEVHKVKSLELRLQQLEMRNLGQGQFR